MPMLTVQEAYDVIMDQVRPFSAVRDVESVPLDAAFGRILTREIYGSTDSPAWDNSAMDGYAIAYRDVESWSEESPLPLKVVMEVAAGVEPTRALSVGEAARIFTGAMLPEGADTVVMQEQTQGDNNEIWLLKKPKPFEFVRKKGCYYQANSPLFAPGLRISATDLGILAAFQCSEVNVYRQPVVAIVSTGNELVAPDESIRPGQIVDSNRYVLAALVRQAGALAVHYKPIGDDLEALKTILSQALNASDVVISTGGVSVGTYDYVDRALSELGGTLHFQSVAVKPGKPLTFTTFERNSLEKNSLASGKGSEHTLYFGLPGNPVSASVSFWRFVQPALLKLAGLAAGFEPQIVQAVSEESLTLQGQRETYVWGFVRWQDSHYVFSPAPGHQISGNLINLAQINGLGILKSDRPTVQAGELLSIILI